MSKLEVNTIAPQSGTTVTLGESGDTVALGSGVTAGTGIGTTINNNADNRIITGSGTANTLEGESGLTFDGTTLLYSKNSSSVLKALEFKNLQADTGAATGISFDFELDNSNANNPKAQMAVKEDANDGYAVFTFSTSPASNSSTLGEKMRIASNGVQMGNLNENLNLNNSSHGLSISANGYAGLRLRRGADNGQAAAFYGSSSSSTPVGDIVVTTSSTAYNTSSDYRLKENETPIVDGIERLKQLKPYKFNFKADADTTVDGFFAHEVSSVVPEAISGEKDATETYTDENGDEQTIIKPQAIDQSKLVPLLTSALQEAITKIETLEARVQTLEDA